MPRYRAGLFFSIAVIMAGAAIPTESMAKQKVDSDDKFVNFYETKEATIMYNYKDEKTIKITCKHVFDGRCMKFTPSPIQITLSDGQILSCQDAIATRKSPGTFLGCALVKPMILIDKNGRELRCDGRVEIYRGKLGNCDH